MSRDKNEQLIQENYRNIYALAQSLATAYGLAF
jgi:hypothetical protein